MTQSFDEYQKSDDAICMKNDYNRKIYEAGAQSKQAEIDEYKEVASSMEDVYIREKAKVDELRKQLDLINQYTAAQGESIKICNGERLELRKRIDKAIDELEYPTATWDETVFYVINILKGTTNEQ